MANPHGKSPGGSDVIVEFAGQRHPVEVGVNGWWVFLADNAGGAPPPELATRVSG